MTPDDQLGSLENPAPDTAVPDGPESASRDSLPASADDPAPGVSPSAGPPPEPGSVPVTGDASIDAVVVELAASRDGSLDDQVEAAGRLERVLNDRLGDLDSG